MGACVRLLLSRLRLYGRSECRENRTCAPRRRERRGVTQRQRADGCGAVSAGAKYGAVWKPYVDESASEVLVCDGRRHGDRAFARV